MEEIWKDIEGFEGRYQISSLGRVKSFLVDTENGMILKPMVCTNGYLRIDLRNNGKYYKFLVHRVVAETFLPNPNNFEYVNHKDESRDNNCVDNLEWCTPKYNANYGTAKQRIADAKSKPIVQYEKNGDYLKTWKSSMEVQRTLGFDRSSILRCCMGKQATSYKYIWQYAQAQ